MKYTYILFGLLLLTIMGGAFALTDTNLNVFNRDFESAVSIGNAGAGKCQNFVCAIQTGTTTSSIIRDTNLPAHATYNLYTAFAWNLIWFMVKCAKNAGIGLATHSTIR
jgi:hypothetical protein